MSAVTRRFRERSPTRQPPLVVRVKQAQAQLAVCISFGCHLLLVGVVILHDDDDSISKHCMHGEAFFLAVPMTFFFSGAYELQFFDHSLI